jgi:hypothetical protein
MAVIRLILLVSLLGGLTLLLVQNFSPVLPLVFLGMRTLPLPLALLILFSTAAGAFTSLLMTTLLRLSNLFAGQQKTPIPSPSPRRQTTPSQEPTTSRPSQPPSASKTEKTTSSTFDDWDNNGEDDDWDIEEQSQTAGSGKVYERQQTPKSGSQSGSVYSYNYKEPKNTAVGKTESVYDADYRVIIPPYQPPKTNQTEDDDWDFFNDDDAFEDENKPTRR